MASFGRLGQAWVSTAVTIVTMSGIVFAQTRCGRGAEQVLAVSGDSVPGVPGAQLRGVSGATLNDAGQVAFLAELKPGAGGVTSVNDDSLWRISGTTREVIARSGGSAPAGGAFATFEEASIDATGQLVVRATTALGGKGIWRYPTNPANGVAIAVTDGLPAPAVPGAVLDSIQPALVHSPHGEIALGGKLRLGMGGVSSLNDSALWLHAGGQTHLLAREADPGVPGIPSAQFSSLSAHAVNRHGQVATLGAMKVNSDVVLPTTATGIWALQAGGGILVARNGVGNVPGVPDGSFSQFNSPTINDHGQLAFSAELELEVAASETNRQGLWRYNGAVGTLLARSEDAAPGITGAQFASFGDAILNDAGQTLVQAKLVSGVGGVTNASDAGLWLYGNGSGDLLARTGSGSVPGVPSASFGSFETIAMNASGLIAVQAALAVGAGGVTAANEQGIWLLNPAGGGQLIAREGQSIGGRTIASLQFQGGSGGSDGRASTLNASGQLVYRATFTNGDEGLFLHTISTGGLAADFDGDGDVDGADLSRWRTNFGLGTSAARAHGNADADADVDGADFLLWQRSVTATAGTIAVPESCSAVLAACASIAGLVRAQLAKRAHCPTADSLLV